MKFFTIVVAIFTSTVLFCQQNDYEFIGTHYFASYYECDKEVLDDVKKLESLIKIASEKAGATVLNIIKHKFQPSGVTVLALLSESHASIHTYPEDRACFVDLFTCGTTCDYKKFHETLEKVLKAQKISEKILVRD